MIELAGMMVAFILGLLVLLAICEKWMFPKMNHSVSDLIGRFVVDMIICSTIVTFMIVLMATTQRIF